MTAMALQNADKYLEETRSVKDGDSEFRNNPQEKRQGSVSGYKLAGQQDIGGASLKEESPLLSEEMNAFRDSLKPFLSGQEPIVDESGTFNNHGRKEKSPPLSENMKELEDSLEPYLSYIRSSSSHGRKDESPPLSEVVKAFRDSLKPFLSYLRRRPEAIVEESEQKRP